MITTKCQKNSEEGSSATKINKIEEESGITTLTGPARVKESNFEENFMRNKKDNVLEKFRAAKFKTEEECSAIAPIDNELIFNSEALEKVNCETVLGLKIESCRSITNEEFFEGSSTRNEKDNELKTYGTTKFETEEKCSANVSIDDESMFNSKVLIKENETTKANCETVLGLKIVSSRSITNEEFFEESRAKNEKDNEYHVTEKNETNKFETEGECNAPASIDESMFNCKMLIKENIRTTANCEAILGLKIVSCRSLTNEEFFEGNGTRNEENNELETYGTAKFETEEKCSVSAPMADKSVFNSEVLVQEKLSTKANCESVLELKIVSSRSITNEEFIMLSESNLTRGCCEVNIELNEDNRIIGKVIANEFIANESYNEAELGKRYVDESNINAKEAESDDGYGNEQNITPKKAKVGQGCVNESEISLKEDEENLLEDGCVNEHNITPKETALEQGCVNESNIDPMDAELREGCVIISKLNYNKAALVKGFVSESKVNFSENVMGEYNSIETNIDPKKADLGEDYITEPNFNNAAVLKDRCATKSNFNYSKVTLGEYCASEPFYSGVVLEEYCAANYDVNYDTWRQFINDRMTIANKQCLVELDGESSSNASSSHAVLVELKGESGRNACNNEGILSDKKCVANTIHDEIESWENNTTTSDDEMTSIESGWSANCYSDDSDCSLEQLPFTTKVSTSATTRIGELVKNIMCIINQSDTVTVTIDCKEVWSSALKTFQDPNFSPFNKINVQFRDIFGENADMVQQGPRREFLRLLIEHLQKSKLFCGPMTSRLLTLDQEG